MKAVRLGDSNTVSCARNYAEFMAHYLMMSDYRREDLLDAITTLRTEKNIIKVILRGPGKEPKPGAPLTELAPFIQLGLIQWR